MPTKNDSLSLKKAILEWSKTTKLPIITKIIDSKSNTIIKYAYSLIFIILSGITIKLLTYIKFNFKFKYYFLS